MTCRSARLSVDSNPTGDGASCSSGGHDDVYQLIDMLFSAVKLQLVFIDSGPKCRIIEALHERAELLVAKEPKVRGHRHV